MPKARRVSRARDKRADLQLQENIQSSEKPAPHAETHSAGGNDTITPSSIGAETPQAAQAKADSAETAAKSYTDTHEDKSNPHSGSASNTDITSLQQQIDDLETRITALENA